MIGPSIRWAVFLKLLFVLQCLFLPECVGEKAPYVPDSIEKMKDFSNNDDFKEEKYCEFSTRTCAWNATENIKWHNGRSTSLELEGPLNDRGFASSIVIYFNDSFSTQEFTSPVFDRPSSSYECFSFRFFSMLEGPFAGGLRLYWSENNGNWTEIWSRSSVDIDRWISEQIQIVTKNSYQLKFSANGAGGFIALQDFDSSTFCKKSICDFESGVCKGWKLKGFSVTRASETKFEHPVDHTTRSGFGKFAFIDLEEHKTHQEVPVVIEGPEIANLGTQCLTFSFMKSKKEKMDASIKLLIQDLSEKSFKVTPLWASNFSHLNDEWMTIRHTVKIESIMKFIFQVDPQASGNPLLAIDDIDLSPGPCSAPVSCNFDEDFCGWHANMKYSNHWSIGKGRILHANKLKTKNWFLTGSSLLYSDFTRIDGSTPEVMELISENVEINSVTAKGMCLGMDVNVVSIGDKAEFTLEQEPLSAGRTVLWRWKAMKYKLNTWIRPQQIYIPNVSRPYRLFLSVTSQDPSTRIAVQNLYFTSDLSKCKKAKGMPPMEPTKEPPKPEPNPFEVLACSFKGNSLCAWTSSEGASNFTITSAWDWKGSAKYIPQTDYVERHNSGRFAIAYAFKSTGQLNKATLSATWPRDHPKDEVCIDFAYYFYISGAGNWAKLTATNDLKGTRVIWSAPPGMSNQWHRVKFSFNYQHQIYDYLTFQTNIVEGVFALDAINIQPGACDETLAVDHERVCDFEDDTSCIFNPEFVVGLPQWRLYQGETKGVLSIRDKSTNTLDGHFYGVSFNDLYEDENSFEQDIAIHSRPLKAKERGVNCIRFSYYIEKVNQKTAVFGYEIRDNNPSESHAEQILKQWQLSGSTNGLWLSHHIPVSWSEDSFIKFFIRVKNSTALIQDEGKIFMDDFLLTTDRCPVDLCSLEEGSDCFLEPVPIGTKPMPSSVQMGFIRIPQNGGYPQAYLNDWVDEYFRILGPYQDRTFDIKKSNGEFLGNYLLLTADSEWHRAIMVTDRFTINENLDSRQLCLSFHVNMADKGSILQIVVADSYSQKATLLYTIGPGLAGAKDRWKKIELQAEPENDDVLDMYFYFVGTISEANSYIALDDIQMKLFCDGTPDNFVTETPGPIVTGSSGSTTPSLIPDPTKFQCESGEKIPVEKQCDWVKDCKDGTDERDCGACNFEHQFMCGYMMIPQSVASMFGGFEWKLNQEDPETEGEISLPYAIARNTRGYDFEKDNDPLIAVIQSNLIHQVYADCMLTFQYRPNGTDLWKNKFEVKLTNLDSHSRQTIWQSHMQKLEVMKWHEVSIQLGRIASQFTIVFTGQISTGSFESHSLRKIELDRCGPVKPVKDITECERFNQFLCENKVCIETFKKCNFVDNCGDASDEQKCNADKMMDFSNGYSLFSPNPRHDGTRPAFELKATKSIDDFRHGPLFDHTRGPSGVEGHYAIFFPDVQYRKDENVKEFTASLESVYFRVRRGCEVSFFVFSSSPDNTLFFHLEDVEDSSWNETPSEVAIKTDSWILARAPFFEVKGSDPLYKMVITATVKVTKAYLGVPYIAIDDITFNSECEISHDKPAHTKNPDDPNVTKKPQDPNVCATFKCKTTNGTEICLKPEQLCDFVPDCKDNSDEKNCGSCNFDEGTLCDWTVDQQRRHIWKVQKPAKEAEDGLLQVDAANNKDGGYLYAWSPDKNFDKKNLVLAKIISPKINAPTSENCVFRFAYKRLGDGIIKVGIQGEAKDSESQMLFELKKMPQIFGPDPKAKEMWRVFSIDIGARPAGLRFFVEGFAENYPDSYLDNFLMVDCYPNSTRDDDKVSCDFEDDTCGWENFVSHESKAGLQSNWMRISNDQVEPGQDHTSLIEPPRSKSGTWMSAVSVDSYYSFAYLRTHLPLSVNQQYCFSFWYYMMSYDTLDEIKLYSVPPKALPHDIQPGKNGEKVLAKFGEFHQRNWVQRYVELEASDEQRFLLFVAEVKPQAAIGLDDILLTKGNCSQFSTGGSCDFEIDQCAWKVENWERQTDKVFTHKDLDRHGHYMSLTKSGDQESAMSLKLTDAPELNIQDGSEKTLCVHVSYEFIINKEETSDNTYIGVRAVEDGAIVKSVNMSAAEAELLSLFQNRFEWHMLAMNFKASTRSKLEVYARKDSQKTDIFVDEIQLYDRPCQVNGDCDFENDMCGYKNYQSSYIPFTRFQPKTKWQGRSRFLSTDTTTQSSNGHYLYYPLFQTDKHRVQQFLKGPFTRAPSATICVKFNYFVMSFTKGESVLHLELMTETHQMEQPFKVEIPSTDFQWTKFSHTFKDVPKFFSFGFRLVDTVQFMSDLGIDDIKISPGECDSGPVATTPVPEEEKQWDCNFELSSVCNWAADSYWVVGNYAEQNDTLAPIHDHTTALPSGHYAFLKSGIYGRFSKNTPKIKTTLSLNATGDHCLSFWHYDDGEFNYQVDFKTVDAKGEEDRLGEFSTQIENRKRWSFHRMNIPARNFEIPKKPFNLLIQYANQDMNGFDTPKELVQYTKFAIDDIQLRPGLCGHQIDYVYTFEHFIDFEDLQVENIQPIVSNNLEPYKPSDKAKDSALPKFDHTTGNGQYALFQPHKTFHDYSSNSLSIVNLRSDEESVKCVKFAYQLSPNVTFKAFILSDSQNDYDYDHAEDSMVWRAEFPTPKNTWVIGEFFKSQTYVHKVVFFFAGVSRGETENFIAMDDLVVKNLRCQKPIECDFEHSNFCSYTMMRDSKEYVDFGLVTAPVKDPNWPGPIYDHTTGNFGSGYLVLTGFKNSKYKTPLRSKIISGARDVTPGENYCLKMFTRLNTKDAFLKLTLLRIGLDYDAHINIDKNIYLLISISGVEQKDWTELNINLNETVTGSANQIHLIIEASLAENSNGSVAIDDITIEKGACQPKNAAFLVCEDGTQLNSSQICNFVKDCESGLDEAVCGTCDFESGLCGWKNVTSINSGKFSLVSAKDSSIVMPKTDGSLKSDGHYLVLKRKLGRIASIMRSKAEMAVNHDQSAMYLKMAYSTCVMSFDVYVSSTVFSPHILISVGGSMTEKGVIYAYNIKSTNNTWQKVHVHLGHQWKPFVVDVSGTGQGSTVIAFDNFKFDNCSMPKPKSACDDGEFRCQKYGFCIPKESVCDDVNDCSDNSDEEKCTEMASRCNFELTLQACDITIKWMPDSPSWRLTSFRKMTTDGVLTVNEPMIDNTLRDEFGTFLLLAPGSDEEKGMTGAFSSLMITSKPSGNCRMRFFYYIHDNVADVENSRLVIQKRLASKSSPEDSVLATISVSREFQQRWNKKVIQLTDTEPFQVIFSGVLGTKDARIAIDDITYDENCQISDTLPATPTMLPVSDVTVTKPWVTDSLTISTESRDEATTESVLGDRNNNAPSGHSPALYVGIAVPVAAVLIVVGAVIWYRVGKTTKDDKVVFSLNNLTKKRS